MAITKTFDILNINGVKGYIRDSWSRRKIVALQNRLNTITEITGTTDANGNLLLFSNTDTHVIAVWANRYVLVPFVYDSATYAKVMSTNASHTAITSAAVTAYYIAI